MTRNHGGVRVEWTPEEWWRLRSTLQARELRRLRETDIVYRYNGGMKVAELGEIFGLSRRQVCTLLERMRAKGIDVRFGKDGGGERWRP